METNNTPQKRPEGSRAHELKLNLVGRVRTTVTESRSNGLQTTTHNVVDDNNFLCQAVALGSFASGWVANGTHTFPFSFSLPPDVLPSLEVRLCLRVFSPCCCFLLSGFDCLYVMHVPTLVLC